MTREELLHNIHREAVLEDALHSLRASESLPGWDDQQVLSEIQACQLRRRVFIILRDQRC